MRLYSRTGATALDHPVHGHFEPGPDGGFDFPNPLSDELHSFAVGGQRLWETEIERQHRLISEERARRQDPESLLSAVEQLMKAAQAAATVQTPPAEAAPAVEVAKPRRSTKRAAPSTPPAE